MCLKLQNLVSQMWALKLTSREVFFYVFTEVNVEDLGRLTVQERRQLGFVFLSKIKIVSQQRVARRTRFSDLGQTGFTSTTKQQTNKTVPRGRFFRRRLVLVLEFSKAIDVEALYTKHITSFGISRTTHVARSS